MCVCVCVGVSRCVLVRLGVCVYVLVHERKNIRCETPVCMSCFRLAAGPEVGATYGKMCKELPPDLELGMGGKNQNKT